MEVKNIWFLKLGYCTALNLEPSVSSPLIVWTKILNLKLT